MAKNNNEDKYRQKQKKTKNVIIFNKKQNQERIYKKVDLYLGESRSTEAWIFIVNLRKENINKINRTIIKIY